MNHLHELQKRRLQSNQHQHFEAPTVELVDLFEILKKSKCKMLNLAGTKKSVENDENTHPTGRHGKSEKILTEYQVLCPERPNRVFGRDADIPEARKQGATYPWGIPKTQNFMKVVKVVILVNFFVNVVLQMYYDVRSGRSFIFISFPQ